MLKNERWREESTFHDAKAELVRNTGDADTLRVLQRGPIAMADPASVSNTTDRGNIVRENASPSLEQDPRCPPKNSLPRVREW